MENPVDALRASPVPSRRVRISAAWGQFVRSAREGRTKPMRGEPSGEGLEDKISEDRESDPNV